MMKIIPRKIFYVTEKYATIDTVTKKEIEYQIDNQRVSAEYFNRELLNSRALFKRSEGPEESVPATLYEHGKLPVTYHSTITAFKHYLLIKK